MPAYRQQSPYRCTAATARWTRATTIYLVSVFGTNSAHPDAEQQHILLSSSLQEHLAERGRVPWVFGGDWNMEPPDVMLAWRRGGTLDDPSAPTHRFGKTLDWFLTGSVFPSTIPSVGAIPGTDHYPVTLAIPGNIAATLGWQLRPPAPLDPVTLLHPRDETHQQNWETHFCAPPATWQDWTAEAECCMFTAVGRQPPVTPTRGVLPSYGRQAQSMPQLRRQTIGPHRRTAM